MWKRFERYMMSDQPWWHSAAFAVGVFAGVLVIVAAALS